MRKFYLLILILFSVTNLIAQNFSNKGRDFWVGYGHHQYMSNSTNTQNMDIYLINDGLVPATVRVEIDSSGIVPAQRWWREYVISAGGFVSIENTDATTYSSVATIKGAIPKANLQSQYSASLYDNVYGVELDLYSGDPNNRIFRKKGIHITSDIDIVAYSHIYGIVSSGASMLFPTSAWGYSYTSINSKQSYANNCHSWLYVIAKENNTKIEIVPSVATIRYPKDTTLVVELQKGQIYQLGGRVTGSSGNELTGTSVRSITGSDGIRHKIAVFSGSSRTSGETDLCSSGGGDNEMVQLFPDQSWGKRYLTANLASSNSVQQFNCNVYKIMVKDPATQVRVNGTLLNTNDLILNKYYKIGSDGSSTTTSTNYIEADQPIAVAQYLAGTTGAGDPDMVVLSPIEQATNNVNFYTNTKEGIVQNLVTIIIPTGGTALSSLRINNATVATSSATDYIFPHPKLAEYSVVVKKLPNINALINVRSDSSFIGTSYGLGSVESYAYNIGCNIDSISSVYSPLPVKLINFNAKIEKENVALNWEVVEEKNVKEYQIQRAVNGIEFSAIGKVPAKMISKYNFTDYSILNNSDNAFYYRLKVIDNDGTYNYSEIRKIEIQKTNKIKIYPTRFTSLVNVSIEADNKDNGELVIKDILGKTLKTQKVQIEKGINNFALDNLGDLKQGTYFIILNTNKAKPFVSQIVK